MRILLVNVPHPSIGSRIPDDHLPPLGLLSIGGPLIDDGHDVLVLGRELSRATELGQLLEVSQFGGCQPRALLRAHGGRFRTG